MLVESTRTICSTNIFTSLALQNVVKSGLHISKCLDIFDVCMCINVWEFLVSLIQLFKETLEIMLLSNTST